MDRGKEQVVFSVLNTYIHTLTHPNSSYVHHWYSCKQRNPVGREPLLCLVHIGFFVPITITTALYTLMAQTSFISNGSTQNRCP